MSTHHVWKICRASFFLLAVAALVSSPAIAADKSKSNKKDKNDGVTIVAKTVPENQDSIEQILANSSGPPIDNPGKGFYYKIVPGNGKHVKYIVNYFKNGHKENQSGWMFCGTDSCPYGQ